VVRGLDPRLPLHSASDGRPDFAKRQLILMLRECICTRTAKSPHTNGPSRRQSTSSTPGPPSRYSKSTAPSPASLTAASSNASFHKLLLNFTWWVNRKDAEGRNVFQGGFLGLDNIGIFDRSAPLPTGGKIEIKESDVENSCIF